VFRFQSIFLLLALCHGVVAQADFLFIKTKPEVRCKTLKCDPGLHYFEKLSGDDTRVCGCQRNKENPIPVGVWFAEDKDSEKRIHETSYNDEGLRHGVEKQFDSETGALREERNYFAGKLHGLRKHWDEEGNPMGMECFVAGEREPVHHCGSAELVTRIPASASVKRTLRHK